MECKEQKEGCGYHSLVSCCQASLPKQNSGKRRAESFGRTFHVCYAPLTLPHRAISLFTEHSLYQFSQESSDTVNLQCSSLIPGGGLFSHQVMSSLRGDQDVRWSLGSVMILYKTEPREFLVLLIVTQQKSTVCLLGSGPHQTPDLLVPRTTSFQHCRQ